MTSISSEGYVVVSRGRYEHRVVWAEAHGPIPPGFHVHHINGVRTDNRLENLELIDAREHGREHAYAGHAVRWNYTPGGPCHICGSQDWNYRKSGRRDCRVCSKRSKAGYKPKPKVCPFCGVTFAASLKRHIGRKHPDRAGLP